VTAQGFISWNERARAGALPECPAQQEGFPYLLTHLRPSKCEIERWTAHHFGIARFVQRLDEEDIFGA